MRKFANAMTAGLPDADEFACPTPASPVWRERGGVARWVAK